MAGLVGHWGAPVLGEVVGPSISRQDARFPLVPKSLSCHQLPRERFSPSVVAAHSGAARNSSKAPRRTTRPAACETTANGPALPCIIRPLVSRDAPDRHRDSSGRDRHQPRLGERASVACGCTGVPAGASLPFDRASERPVPRLLERSHRSAGLRRTRCRLEPSVADYSSGESEGRVGGRRAAHERQTGGRKTGPAPTLFRC